MKERTEGSARGHDDPRATAREMMAAAEAEEVREAAALRTTVNVALAFFAALVILACSLYLGRRSPAAPYDASTSTLPTPALASPVPTISSVIHVDDALTNATAVVLDGLSVPGLEAYLKSAPFEVDPSGLYRSTGFPGPTARLPLALLEDFARLVGPQLAAFFPGVVLVSNAVKADGFASVLCAKRRKSTASRFHRSPAAARCTHCQYPRL